MTVADHLPQARFDVDERRRQPALPLTRVLPRYPITTSCVQVSRANPSQRQVASRVLNALNGAI